MIYIFPLVSIIVPVYNVEKYVSRCVESIINQTYKKLEIIIIDDGSTDNSGSICDNYSKVDNRIIVIHKTNAGLSDARNCGLHKCSGEYVFFVDSDDYIHINAIENLVNILIKYCADIVECNTIHFNDKSVIETYKNECIIEQFNTEQAIKELILERKLHQTVWNKLYRRKIIDIDFEVGKINEDEFWTFQIFSKAKNIVLTNERFYYYFQREDSIMHTKYSIKRLDGVEAREKRLIFIINNFSNLENVARYDLLWAFFYHYQCLSRNKDIDKEYKYRNLLYKKYIEYYNINCFFGIDFIQKLWMYLFRYCPNFVCQIRNILGIGY